MAIAFDAFSKSSTGFDNATISWTHTPVGTPKGAVVVVCQEASADDIDGVTYGGVAMARIKREVKAAAEAGCVYIYFLGSGLGTGAKTVTVTAPTSNDWCAVCFTVTADSAETEAPVTAGAQSDSQANPSLSISPTAAAVICYGIVSGLAAPITTNETNTIHVGGSDFGADSAMWARKTVASAGATTIGYTAAADDVIHAACAVQELVVAAGQPTMMRWGGVHNMARTSRQRRGW